MSETIDARGLSCPQPVILAKKAIKRGVFPVELLVDSPAARENVTRMAIDNGCTVTEKGEGEERMLLIDKRMVA